MARDAKGHFVKEDAAPVDDGNVPITLVPELNAEGFNVAE